jgi:hypothetical protein
MATTPKLLTYEEWLKLPEVEGIEEVVGGRDGGDLRLQAAVEGQIAPLHFPAALVDIAAIWPARK